MGEVYRMTQDDLNNEQEARAGAQESTISEVDADKVVTSWDVVRFSATLPTTMWDEIKASAADALVFVQWLDSKRP